MHALVLSSCVRALDFFSITIFIRPGREDKKCCLLNHLAYTCFDFQFQFSSLTFAVEVMAEQSRSGVCLPAAPHLLCVAASVPRPLIHRHSYKTRRGVVSLSEDLGLKMLNTVRLSLAG